MAQVVQRTKNNELPYDIPYASFPGFKCFDNVNLLCVSMSSKDISVDSMRYDTGQQDRGHYDLTIDGQHIKMRVNPHAAAIPVTTASTLL